MSPPASPHSAVPRTAYLVLGMHRSGTSAVTQLLALAGAKLPANVMPGDEHNAKGYFEPWRIAIFNDERLRAAGSAWHDPFAFPFRALDPPLEAAWVERAADLLREEYRGVAWPLVKDPRATVLMPFWRAVLAEAGMSARCVIPVRHPLAVAGSLRRRDNFAEQRSLLVWTSYMLAAEAYTRDLPRAFVGYDALLADWRTEVKRIETAHGATLPKLTEAGEKRIDRFLTPELRHNAGQGDLAAYGWAGALAAQVLAWFEAAAAGETPPRAALEAAAAELARHAAEIGPLVTPMAHELEIARADLAAARAELDVSRRFADELRTTAERDREDLEGKWRADIRRWQEDFEVERRHFQDTAASLSIELDRALADG